MEAELEPDDGGRADPTTLGTGRDAVPAVRSADPTTIGTGSDSVAKLAVPMGEFGGAQETSVEPDALRAAHEQRTIKRDPAHAILGIADPLNESRPKRAVVVVDDELPEPTELGFDRPDITEIGGRTELVNAGARLRSGAQLRRKRGVFGDVRYVATALFGVRRARGELTTLEGRQTTLQVSRKRHLLTLGRAAVSAEDLEHPALGKAREELAEIEDERSQHAAQVQAADSELMRVRTDRAEAAAAYATAVARLDAELGDVAKKLEPLEKEVASIGKRATELRESLARLDQQIAEAQTSLHSVKGQKLDRDGVHAEIATLKADRVAVQRDEPVIASELDAINPRIAALEARRSDAKKRRAELDSEEISDKKRAEELMTAIGAKRVVVDRASNDAEALRDKLMTALGEQLYVDRPDDLRYELAPIDAIDVELGTVDRRIMELREILGSVDRWKLARGLAVIVVTLAAVGSFTWWVLANI